MLHAKGFKLMDCVILLYMYMHRLTGDFAGPTKYAIPTLSLGIVHPEILAHPR